MTITAARIGNSPLLLDWHGLPAHTERHTAPSSSVLHQKWNATLEKLNVGVSGFYNAVSNPKLSQIEESLALAQKIRSNPKITDCLFIGIGGSSLGPMCLIDSLKHHCDPHVQFHFFENPDPIDWLHRIKRLKPENTLITVVTKSGTTYETLSLFMVAYDWLKKELGKNSHQQIVAITDPEKGELLEFAKQNSISTLAIHPSVGGRYSIFTPVGLFAGALAGLDMKKLLTGANQVREYCQTGSADHSVFVHWGAALQTLNTTHPTHVMMPYSTSLRLFANWWVQLWSESLGKDGKGFTAIPALGAIDQHSMLQLLRDGPNDKVIWFLNVDQFKASVPVPDVGFSVKSFDLLAGQELGSILNTEFRSIQKVMTNQNRPHLQIQVDEINEASVGALFFTFCVLTSYMGELMEVNPFDQPGVEEGKIYIREKLTQMKADLS